MIITEGEANIGHEYENYTKHKKWVCLTLKLKDLVL